MKKMRRAIVFEILGSFFIVVLIIVVLQVLVSLLSQSSALGRNGCTIPLLLLTILKEIPAFLYRLMPVIGFISVLVGLARMSQRLELVVMQTAGYTFGQMLRSVLLVSVLLAVLFFSFIECFGFSLARDAQISRAHYRGQNEINPESIWFRDKQKFIHIDIVDSPTALEKVFVFWVSPAGQLERLTYAAHVLVRNHHWLLQDVSEVSMKNADLQRKTLKTSEFDTSVDAAKLGLILRSQSAYKSVFDLFRMTYSTKPSFAGKKIFTYGFWEHVVAPFIMVLMMCFALPFVIKYGRNRTMTTQVCQGGGIGFLVYMFDAITLRLGAYFSLNPVVTALFPLVVLFVIFVMLVRKKV